MSRLEAIIRRFSLDWMIDSYVPPEAAIPRLATALDAANSESAKRFGQNAFPVTVEVLEAELLPHPYRVEAFLQVLAATSSPTMLLMAWRILCGWEIARVLLEFDCGKKFSLDVVLRGDGSDPEENYHSDDISDAAVVRHFGIAHKNDQPCFDGLYALHLSG